MTISNEELTQVLKGYPGTSRLYFEAHITLDPVSEDKREALADVLMSQANFKLAKLLMDKGVPSTLDTFATSHHTDLKELTKRVEYAVEALRGLGYVVRRYKIEDTILDSRCHDVLGLL